MGAFWTDLQIALQFNAIQHRAAIITFAPQPFGHLTLVVTVSADAGGNEFFVPAHGEINMLLATEKHGKTRKKMEEIDNTICR
jgi:hypothetical protein